MMKKIIIVVIIACLGADIWAVRMIINSSNNRNITTADIERPWRKTFRIAFGALILVGTSSLLGYMALRYRDWQE